MRGNRAFSVLEMVVILLSATLVGSMALHLMATSVRSVNQQMSVASRIDRLRLLQTVLERDLDSRYPESEASTVRIASATSITSPQVLFSAQVLIQETSPQVDLEQVEYRFDQEDPSESRLSLFRTLKTVSQTPSEASKILFRLEETESLAWSASPEVRHSSAAWTRLHLNFEDSRYKDFPVMREMLIRGRVE